MVCPFEQGHDATLSVIACVFHPGEEIDHGPVDQPGQAAGGRVDLHWPVLEPGVAIGLFGLALVIGGYGSIIGAGGGFLLIPGLALLFGLDGAEAVGTGVITLACLHAAGSVAYDRQGLVERTVAAWWAVTAAPVALLSGWLLTNRLDSDVLLTIIGLLMIALAVFVAMGSMGGHQVGTDTPARSGVGVEPRVAALLVGASGVGFLNGAFAVGGGLIAVPYLARVQRLSAHRAAATTAAAGMAASSAAAVGHALAGNIVWAYAPPLILGAVIGSSTGARLGPRLSPRTVMVLLSAGLVTTGAPLIGFARWA